MNRTAGRILEQALKLSEAERAEIADALLESIGPETETATEAEWEAAWRQEVAARVEAMDAGKSKTIPWEEVHGQLRAQLRKKQQN